MRQKGRSPHGTLPLALNSSKKLGSRAACKSCGVGDLDKLWFTVRVSGEHGESLERVDLLLQLCHSNWLFYVSSSAFCRREVVAAMRNMWAGPFRRFPKVVRERSPLSMSNSSCFTPRRPVGVFHMTRST